MTNTETTLSPRVQRELAQLVSGGVFHNGLCRVLRIMEREGISAEQAEAVLEDWAADCRPDTQSHEIPDAVRFIYGVASDIASPSMPKAQISAVRVLARRRDAWNTPRMRAESDPIPPLFAQSSAILPLLFGESALVCMGMDRYHKRPAKPLRGYRVRPLSDWQLVVPNVAAQPTGARKSDGASTGRALSMFPKRLWAVIETDDERISLEEWVAVLGHLGTRGNLGALPLGLVVHSGGKSLHGWYAAAGATEEQIDMFYREACRLGADRATQCRAQFVRVPGGTRYDERGRDIARHAVQYLNRAVISANRKEVF